MVKMIFTGICAFFFAVVTIFQAVYTFGNPDPTSCWVVRDLQAASLTREGIIAKANSMGVDVVEGYPIEMHKVYHAWFAWGFWANFLIMLANTTFWGLEKYYYMTKTALIGHGVAGSLYCLSSVFWLLFGSIWRFSKAGTVASGDRIERVTGQTDEEWSDTL